MKFFFTILLCIANIHCKADGITITGEDGKKWTYIATHSNWTQFDDWYYSGFNQGEITGGRKKGSFYESKEGLFHMVSTHIWRKWRAYARSDYKDLAKELENHYPGCSPRVWDEDWSFIDLLVYIEFDGEDIKKIERG